ncbi:MAG TPA: hypothetical protein VIJ94_11715 [Caulobacteraceae bacterium]
MQSNFEINTRDDGAVEVVVRPSGARPFRLVGFASTGSAEDWVRMRVAREDPHVGDPPPPGDRLGQGPRFY